MLFRVVLTSTQDIQDMYPRSSYEASLLPHQSEGLSKMSQDSLGHPRLSLAWSMSSTSPSCLIPNLGLVMAIDPWDVQGCPVTDGTSWTWD